MVHDKWLIHPELALEGVSYIIGGALLLTTRRRLRQGLTSPLWTRLSCRVEKLDPIGRDAPLRVDQIHSPCFHLHRQEILDRILLLEEPLWERNVRRPALGP